MTVSKIDKAIAGVQALIRTYDITYPYCVYYSPEELLRCEAKKHVLKNVLFMLENLKKE